MANRTFFPKKQRDRLFWSLWVILWALSVQFNQPTLPPWSRVPLVLATWVTCSMLVVLLLLPLVQLVRQWWSEAYINLQTVTGLTGLLGSTLLIVAVTALRERQWIPAWLGIALTLLVGLSAVVFLALFVAAPFWLWNGDRQALRDVRTLMRRMAGIAPEELRPTYADMTRRVERIITCLPAQQRPYVREVLDGISNELMRVLFDATPGRIGSDIHDRLAQVNTQLQHIERRIVLSDEF